MLTLSDYITWVRSGQIDPQHVLKQYQEKASHNALNSWISYTPEYTAEHFDQFLERSLCAAPIGVKDIIMTKGLVTTCGSRILGEYTPPYSATCFLNLEQAWWLMIWKNNMDEFAMGGSGEHSAFGATKNPWDSSRVSGGSSSWSAASVANDECLAALGTDTWGSVRQPAAFCGIVGFKPTYGMISRYGVQSMSNSLDQVGTLTKSVHDARVLYNSIRWFDPHDLHSKSQTNVRETAPTNHIKVCVLNSFFGEWIDNQIKERTLEFIKKLGADKSELTIEFVDFDLLEYLVPVYYIIMPAEASTNLARFDGLRYWLQADTHLFDSLQSYYKYIRSSGFGQEVKRRLLLGAYVLSAGYQDQYYNKAIAVRNHIQWEYLKLFGTYDVIIWPTSPVRPWKIGWHANDPVSDYLADLYTVPANLIGAPAMSVPIGFGHVEWHNIPLGLHIMAKPGDDDKVFAMASKVEQFSTNN